MYLFRTSNFDGLFRKWAGFIVSEIRFSKTGLNLFSKCYTSGDPSGKLRSKATNFE